MILTFYQQTRWFRITLFVLALFSMAEALVRLNLSPLWGFPGAVIVGALLRYANNGRAVWEASPDQEGATRS